MSIKSKIRDSLENPTPLDDIIIDRFLIYYELFNIAYQQVKVEGARRRVANLTPGIPNPSNARYFLNLSFSIMNDCARRMQSETELLGLSRKGKKLEITQKVEEQQNTLLQQMNEIPDIKNTKISDILNDE